MVDTFTLLSLIRYTYNESSADEKQQMEEILRFDAEIKAELRIIKEAKQLLPKVSFYPKESTIQNILLASKKIKLV
ncbi:MAG: hypothetical protein IT267_02905 [Saprospiraceae bacterium]|nr:hypothetical protein [Saprospiraceae bacterium]